MAAKIFLNLPGGVKMPAIGLGTLDATNPSELESTLNVALENGYRHIDTAYLYGNESIIGNVLKKWFTSGKLKREDLFITTKLPIFGVHPDRVEFFIKKSLKNLQLDYVDLYLVHFPVGAKYDENANRAVMNEKNEIQFEGKTDHAGVWKKMEEQVDAGRAKTIGLSNYTIAQIETVLQSARIKPANLQTELNVYLQQRKLVDFCNQHGMTVVAYAALGSPNYNNVLKAHVKRMGGDEASIRPLPNILGNPVIKKIAQKHSKTPAQVALRFLVQNGIATVPKSVTPQRIIENITIFDFNLDDDDLRELRNLEVGEQARIRDFKIFKGIEEHPDYPTNNF